MDFDEIVGPHSLCRKRRFKSDPGNLNLPIPHVFLDDTSIRDASLADSSTSKDQHIFSSGELSNDDDDMDVANIFHPDAPSTVEHVQKETDQGEHFIRKGQKETWKVCHFNSLPKWMQDNDYLLRGHRPPLPTFSECFRSMFRIHTETGNIWTHFLGCISFIGIAFYVLTRPSNQIQWREKVVFAIFFAGVITCLGMSFVFHTVYCRSEKISKLFSKLDYCGIAFLIIGSFVPWLYYGFYCSFQPKLIYTILVIVLGTATVIVSLWDAFSEPRYRSLRAGVFVAFGLSGAIPAIHYLIIEGWFPTFYTAPFAWLCLMAVLYITGAIFYALRMPERFCPGKCDIWFNSHQIFHILVIAAACIHYHGISEMAIHRLTSGDCT
ncbi:adiponectin receptor protein [Trichonephila inaurata madagascariensis]|uniref:Adiponectin receptor protein n=1 Tax=Trichonephila inaurata madagascariensis TaxID=2747483 RepID=A0A8X6XE86_9ARAC|nr:adiponectin receptor protein [Trichonephila inaurata madagascariensis]